MTIDGVSQFTGIDRIVEVRAADHGLRLAIRDRKLGIEMSRAVVSADALVSVLTTQPKDSQAIAGEGGVTLRVQVRRNEVLLDLGGHDAAVGLDDLMDAVGDALPAAAAATAPD